MSKEFYRNVVSPILDRLDSETWHDRARQALHFAEISPFTLKLLEFFAYHHRRFSDQRLNVVLGGIELDNPLIVGAGWDKTGKAVRSLYTLGFSGVEVGTVLAYPQGGNPKPRQFIIGPGVAINHNGLNTPGMEKVAQNLKPYRQHKLPIGISIGKNREVSVQAAPEAYAIVARYLYHDATYFAINVSSPNTPGLRQLQDKSPLSDITQAINTTMDEMGERKPMFIKIAPELSNEAVDDVIKVVIDNGLTGIIATNTTTNPDIKARYGESWRNQPGGVSGDDPQFRQMATEKIAHIYKETGGRMEIIGVGGVNSADTALEKIRAGARAVQIVTAIRSVGTTLPGRINRDLVEFMEREGIRKLDEIRGYGVK